MSPTRRTAVLLGLAALSALWLPPAATLAVLVVVLAVAAGDAWSVREPPDVVRTLPTDVVRGVAVPFAVRAEAPGRRIHVRQPQTPDLRFDPAEGGPELEGSLVSGRRGRHGVPAVVTRSVGLLGMGQWDHHHLEGAVVAVHADLPGARRIAQAVRSGQFRDAGRRRGPLGLGTDFETIRDHVPGDDIRRVNWRATERTGRAMVNQFREDTDRDLWCLLDTGRLLAAPVGDRSRLDAALDAVAAVAAVADVVGDRVGAVVFDDEVRRVVAPRRASAAGLVRSLEDLDPTSVDADYELAFRQVGTAKRSLVVVFTDVLDAAAARPLIDAVPVLARRHALVVAGVADADLLAAVTAVPATARDLLEVSVARDLMAERAAVATQLSGLGASVVDAPVERFPSACVAAYLRLKAAARI